MRTHAVNRLPYLKHRIARLTRKLDQLESLSKSYWRARRGIFLSGALLALLVLYFAGGRCALVLALVFIVLFTVVVVYHNRVLESIRRYKLLIQLNNVQIARIQLDWQQMPATEILQSEKNHPF